MIITQTMLSNFKLLIAAHKVRDSAKLVLIDWLIEDAASSWQDSKCIAKMKKQYNLADNDVQFIDRYSLSAKKPTESLLLATITQLNQYQSCKRQTFSLPLDTASGTPFQQKVWQALQQIPYGQTISYATLAQNINQPKAYRAVANANGKNPFSIVIPCHRVIAKDGSLGGYAGGLDKKRILLKIEERS